MADKEGTSKCGGLIENPDGSLQLLVPEQFNRAAGPQNSLASAHQEIVQGPYGRQYASGGQHGMTHIPPHLGQHLAHHAYYPASSATTSYVSSGPVSPPNSQQVVACPRCGQHLMPPPGAPIFACPCGQRMAPPSVTARTGYQYQPNTNVHHFAYGPPHGPAGWTPPGGPTNSPSSPPDDPFEVVKPGKLNCVDGEDNCGSAAGSGSSAAGGRGPHEARAVTEGLVATGGRQPTGAPTAPDRPSVAGSGPPGTRHVRCPGCHTLLATSTDITVCGVCGTHMNTTVAAPIAAGSTGPYSSSSGSSSSYAYGSAGPPPPARRSGWDVFWKGL